MINRFQPVNFWLALPAVAGSFYCILNLAGVQMFCKTSGCSMYQGYGLFGISFYVYGAVFFALMTFLAFVLCKSSLTETLFYWVILVGLSLNALFLGYQALFWPCMSCLLIAAHFGIVAFLSFKYLARFRNRTFYAVLGVWVFFFVMVFGSVTKEVLASPWFLSGSKDSEIRVFFSPTCEACRVETIKILDQPALDGRVAFIPVAKNLEDLTRLAFFDQQDTDAITAIKSLFSQANPPAQNPSWSLRWRLLRNKMTLAATGSTQVPVVIAAGLPVVKNNEESPQPYFFESKVKGCGLAWENPASCNDSM